MDEDQLLDEFEQLVQSLGHDVAKNSLLPLIDDRFSRWSSQVSPQIRELERRATDLGNRTDQLAQAVQTAERVLASSSTEAVNRLGDVIAATDLAAGVVEVMSAVDRLKGIAAQVEPGLTGVVGEAAALHDRLAKVAGELDGVLSNVLEQVRQSNEAANALRTTGVGIAEDNAELRRDTASILQAVNEHAQSIRREATAMKEFTQSKTESLLPRFDSLDTQVAAVRQQARVENRDIINQQAAVKEDISGLLGAITTDLNNHSIRSQARCTNLDSTLASLREYMEASDKRASDERADLQRQLATMMVINYLLLVGAAVALWMK